MWDILSFNRFVTQDFLILFYYVGAVIVPIVLYLFLDTYKGSSAFLKSISETLHRLYKASSLKSRILFWVIAVSMFLCMELCWRMMFEAMIGYFDMHDYLRAIQQNLKLDLRSSF